MEVSSDNVKCFLGSIKAGLQWLNEVDMAWGGLLNGCLIKEMVGCLSQGKYSVMCAPLGPTPSPQASEFKACSV